MLHSKTARFVFCLLLVLLFGGLAAAQEQRPLIVGPEGDYAAIEDALAAAQAGDTIEVRGGTYGAPLVVDRSVSLIGVGQPVIDGQGTGSLVIIAAPDVYFSGFVLQGTGDSMTREDTAIVVQASGVSVVGNLVQDVLYGIYFAGANDGLARDNTVYCRDYYDSGRRGDAIRIWYSVNVHIDGNDSFGCRDLLVWNAEHVTIENNNLINGRYGLHLMYSNNTTIHNNHFEGNSVGVYLMYSQHITVTDNYSMRNRGPSGYGLAFKDVDHLTVTDNVVIGNRSGLYLDNTPFLMGIQNYFTGNYIAYNDIGISALPAVARNVFQFNSFLENAQQVSTLGRGNLLGNTWQVDGTGNYWSDYAGYDAAGDGRGDSPYRAEKLFESLADEHPALRLFNYSPASQSINFAAAAFPSLRPDPKVIDEAPLMQPVLPPHLSNTTQAVSLPLLAAALLLLAAGGGLCLLTLRTRRITQVRPAPRPEAVRAG